MATIYGLIAMGVCFLLIVAVRRNKSVAGERSTQPETTKPADELMQ